MIELPYPPSLNRYYRTYRGRIIISAEGRKYRKLILDMGMVGNWPKFGSDRLKVVIKVYPPDARRRDLDNVCKGVLDALQKSGVYDDDGQIDDLHIIRQPHTDGGWLSVEIESLGETN